MNTFSFLRKTKALYIQTHCIRDQRSFTHKTTNIHKWLLLIDPVFLPESRLEQIVISDVSLIMTSVVL